MTEDITLSGTTGTSLSGTGTVADLLAPPQRGTSVVGLPALPYSAYCAYSIAVRLPQKTTGRRKRESD